MSETQLASGVWVPENWKRGGSEYMPLVPAEDPRWEALRKPFHASQIGHKPQPWCRACSQNKQQKHCENHRVISCKICRQRVTEAHLDLDFVGHAAVTLRLLEVDPHWAMVFVPHKLYDDLGLPNPGQAGAWIVLRVLGKPQYGIGETEGTQLEGGNAIKALVSDCIKNASMRFGVAIETWSKEDLAAERSAEAEQRDEVNRELGGTTPNSGTQQEEPGEKTTEVWVAEFEKQTNLDDLTKLASLCKEAGQFKGKPLGAARKRKKELEDAAATAAAGQQQSPPPQPSKETDDSSPGANGAVHPPAGAEPDANATERAE